MVANGTWHVDPLHTIVRLHASVLGIGADCLVDVRSGTIAVHDGGRTGSLTAEIDLMTFRSGIERRDSHVKSADFLDVARHPLAFFVATWDDGLPTRLTGKLRVRDVTAPVTLQVEINAESEESATFRAVASVSRREFGVSRTRYVLSDRVDVVIEGAAGFGLIAGDEVYQSDRGTADVETPATDKSR